MSQIIRTWLLTLNTNGTLLYTKRPGMDKGFTPTRWNKDISLSTIVWSQREVLCYYSECCAVIIHSKGRLLAVKVRMPTIKATRIKITVELYSSPKLVATTTNCPLANAVFVTTQSKTTFSVGWESINTSHTYTCTYTHMHVHTHTRTHTHTHTHHVQQS